VVTGFCGALRGEEVPLMDLAVTKYFTEADGLSITMEERRHGVIGLHRRFKNEVGEKCHLMSVGQVTDLGLMPVKWMNQMIAWYAAHDVDSGQCLGLGMASGQHRVSLNCRSRTEACSVFYRKTRTFSRQESERDDKLQYSKVFSTRCDHSS
jgi:hypothetical protein